MPKVFLQFDVPEEDFELKLAANAKEYFYALDDVRCYLITLQTQDSRVMIPRQEVIDELLKLLDNIDEIVWLLTGGKNG